VWRACITFHACMEHQAPVPVLPDTHAVSDLTPRWSVGLARHASVCAYARSVWWGSRCAGQYLVALIRQAMEVAVIRRRHGVDQPSVEPEPLPLTASAMPIARSSQVLSSGTRLELAQGRSRPRRSIPDYNHDPPAAQSPAGKFLISVCSTTAAPPAGVYPSLRRMTSGFCPCAGTDGTVYGLPGDLSRVFPPRLRVYLLHGVRHAISQSPSEKHACMLLVTLMRCVTGGPPGDSAVPLAGDNLSCMNFGTAACVPIIAF